MTFVPYKPDKGNQYRTLYSLIRLQGDTTRQYLAEMTGLAPTSLNRSLDKMMQFGWIEESGLAESTGGRRPNLYCLSSNKIYITCISLESDFVTLSVFDQALQIVDSRKLPALPDIVSELVISDENIEADHNLNIGNIDQNAEANTVTAEDDSGFDLERLEIWWNSLIDNTNEMLLSKDIKNSQIAGTVLLIEEDSVRYTEGQFEITDWIMKKLSGQARPSACISQIDSRLYALLWQLSELPDQTLLAVIADHDTIHMGIAANGLRHCRNLACINAGTLLTSNSENEDIGLFDRQISQNGLLKRFCRIKSMKNLTWQDFITAADQDKRKAMQVISESAGSLAEIIFNSLQISRAGGWILTGSLINDLPSLLKQTDERVTRHADKAGLSYIKHDNSKLKQDGIVEYGAAAFMIEILLSELE